MAQPWNPKARRQLTNLLLRLSDGKSAQGILESSCGAETNDLHEARDTFGLLAVADSGDTKDQAKANKLGQKSIMLTPGRMFNWQSLAIVHSRSVTTGA